MNYLLDTCVLSELRRRAPNAGVLNWLATVSESRLHLPAVVVGEIQQGISQLADSKRKQALQAWLDEDLIRRFDGRVIGADILVFAEWGRLRGECSKQGVTLPVVDSLIASTAIQHNMTLVTRNEADFTFVPVKLLNPWSVLE